jgi:hypothetical protein
MNHPPSTFWTWFCGFAKRLPIDEIPESLQNELLSRLHGFDDRLYFLLSTNATPKELIITAEGNETAFASADRLVDAAPTLLGWDFYSLKPPMGFDFRHTDGPISLDVSQLWFMPTISSDDPPELGVVLGIPDADFVLEQQSVDTAYTILEVAIGERSCTRDIANVAVTELPDDPDANGFLELRLLPEYVAFHKRRYKIEK